MHAGPEAVILSPRHGLRNSSQNLSMSRLATVNRTTRETSINLELELDGSGQIDLTTGVGFLDHMLELLAKHAGFDLKIEAQGDLHVDQHHTVEDIGICFGQALHTALGDKRGIKRYGSIILPMDEALVTIAVDLGGRYWFEYDAPIPTEKIGQFDSELIEHFWQSVASNGLMNLHVLLHRGRNSHHIAEAVFKGTARALREAVSFMPGSTEVPSTKGTLVD